MKKIAFSLLLIFSVQGVNAETVKPASTDSFIKELSSKEESYLKEKLHRNKVGFDLTSKVQGDKTVFQVPDYINRETVYDLAFDSGNNTLSGHVLNPEEVQILKDTAKKYFNNVNINVESFPYNNIDKDYAISNKAISDLYVKPIDQAGENLATQTRLGTPLRILEISADKKFAKVLSEDDNYIAWIKRSEILEKNPDDYSTWQQSRNYIINTDIDKPYKIYAGTILRGEKNANSVTLSLPDNKTLSVKDSQAIKLSDLSKNKDKVINNAKNRLNLGIKGKTNYLWGGSVNSNIDCSGFNQSIFRLEGIMLPRDADQQQSFTKPVAKTLDKINELKPGDLLFFSGNKSYATHTGVYIGNYKFIHSSPKGQYRGIKISTLKGGGEYDKFLQKIYFGGGRI